MAQPVQGNEKSPQKPPHETSPTQHMPTYWQAVGLRAAAIISLLNAIVELSTGTAGGHGHYFTREQDPYAFYFSVGTYLYMAINFFFYAPFHRWVFSLALPAPPPEPPPSPDEYKDYVHPPKPLPRWKSEPLHLSDFYEPAFIKSLLLMLNAFGLIVTLCGVMQLIMGTVYVPYHHMFEILTFKDDGGQFFIALIPYAGAALVTIGLSIALHYWRPVGRGAGEHRGQVEIARI